MKKTLAIFSVSVLALMGGFSQRVHAQSQVSADVGNADSANVLIVGEGYEVVTPDTSGSATPANAAANAASSENAASVNASSAAPNSSAQENGAVVNETVTEAVSPDGVVYEVDQTVN